MKNKNFLSKIEKLKPIVPVQLDVERKLVPRLKFMGYVMGFFSLASLIFGIAVPEDVEAGDELAQESIVNANLPGYPLESDEGILEFTPTEVLNFYVISLIFAAVGTACFVTARKKKNDLFRDP